MPRLVRQFLTFLGLLLLVTVLRFPYDTFGPQLANYLKQEARKHRITLQFDELILGMPARASFSGMGLLIPVEGLAIPIPLRFQQGSASLRLLPLLRLALATQLEATGYGGSVVLKSQQSLLSGLVDVGGLASNIQLQELPVPYAKTTRGQLSVDFELEPFSPQQLDVTTLPARIKVEIKDGEFLGSTATFSPIPLRDVKAINATVAGALQQGSFSFNRCELFSSLGALNCKGDLKLSPRNEIESATISGTLTLTPEGIDYLGGYLALLAETPTANPAKTWDLKLSFSASSKKRYRLSAVPIL